MTSHVSTIDIRQKLGEILDRVALRHDQYVVERKGKPLAVLMPVEKAEAMAKAARLHLLELLTRPAASGPAVDADKLADAAKHESRKG